MLDALLAAGVGVALGLSLAAPPGPMNAVIAEESVRRGWRSGFAAGLGAMAADACFFALALLGVVAVVDDHPTLRGVMVGAGGLLMLYFAYGAAADARREFAADGSAGKGFRKAFALALTNPYQVTWWLTAGVGLLDPTTVELAGRRVSTGGGGPPTVTGFFGGILLWIAAFPAALRAAGDRVARLRVAVAYASALVLAGFGALFLWRAATTLA